MNDRQRQIDKIRKASKSLIHLFKRLRKKINKRRKLEKNFETYDIHKKSVNNFDAIQKSKKCACYYCGRFFDASEIEDWLADNTALCPRCFNASIIQDFNVEITNELLEKLNDEWFGGSRHVAGFGENGFKAHIIEFD